MSSKATSFSRPAAGSHTVEGNKSGGRAAALEKERQRAAEDFEKRKQELASQRSKTTLSFESSAADNSNNSNNTTTTNSNSNFQTAKAAASSVEESFRAATIGLVSADDYVKAQKEATRQEQLLEEEEYLEVKVKEKPKECKKAKKKRKKEKKKMMSTLSFGNELEEDEEEDDAGDDSAAAPLAKKPKSLKDPNVDTSFLPDQQRDAEERAERIRLAREWKEAQKAQRETPLQVTYSYWDGSGHRKSIVVKQGSTIGEFLQKVLDDLIPHFRQLAGLTGDDLIYVKEDLILPADITFYDLIATKARGKSGPLFSFDVHDDVRVGPMDARVEKDDSHPGKVVERRWCKWFWCEKASRRACTAFDFV